MEASLHEVLKSAIDYELSNIYTSIPGIVVSVVDQSTMTVNVQPSINMRSIDGLMVSERPPILNVQMQLPVSPLGGLLYPITVGTPVSLIFSMRGLDAWKRGNGYPTTPTDLRKFDIRDCYAIPLFPPSESPNNPSKHSLEHDPEDVVLVHNLGTMNEVEVRLKSSGQVIINTSSQVIANAQEQVIINTPNTLVTGNLTVNGTMTIDGEEGAGTNVIRGNFNIIGNVLNHNGKDIGSEHTHSGVESGPDNSGPPI